MQTGSIYIILNKQDRTAYNNLVYTSKEQAEEAFDDLPNDDKLQYHICEFEVNVDKKAEE